MAKLTGACLCDAVRFELNDEFQNFNFCHCKQCQRATGSAHACNLFTSPDDFRWTQGEDRVRRYDVPGRAISNAFCADCGSTLPYASRSGGAMIIPAGTLDISPASELEPRHIFWSERANWFDEMSEAPRHERFPA